MSAYGGYLSVTIDGVDFEDVMRWRVTGSAESLNRTTGSTAGFHKGDPGKKRLEGSIDFVQDTTTGFFIDVAEGTILTNLRLWRNSGDTNPAYLLPQALVLTCGHEVAAEGQPVMLPITFESRGTYTKYDPSTPA